MYKAYLSKILAIIEVLLFLFVLLTTSYAKDIYKWVDEDGSPHFTDNPASIPEEKIEEADIIEGKEDGSGSGEEVEVETTEAAPAPSEEESPEDSLEEERKEEALREVWRGRALVIENKEKTILQEVEITRQLIREKKREVDFLLINGYSADYSILELRYLDDHLKELEDQLKLIPQERANLEEEARREGIPPGYLRP